MSDPSAIGRQLYMLLPEIYRSRDNNLRGSDGRIESPGDLARYLDACGSLLDAIKATLDQRLADAFPDNAPPGERSCQAWLLPYFADLLDVRLVSPEVEGRRNEIANAVGWRQRKGTVSVLEAVAESVGRIEAEVQEGWQRVALTARVGMPLLPTSAYGERQANDTATAPAARIARHPGLPAVTPDLQRAARAVRTDPGNPAAKLTHYEQHSAWWRPANRHGAPCFAGSYEDGSRRTVDFRDPDWRRGHHHPRRVLLHVPPEAGFFAAGAYRFDWALRESAIASGRFETLQLEEERDGVLENLTVYRGLGDQPVCIADPVTLMAGGPGHRYRFENLCLEGGITVSNAPVELRDCAVLDANLDDSGVEAPSLAARNTLFGGITQSGGARLEYCTVLGPMTAGALQASDCLFGGTMARHLWSPPDSAPDREAGCLRYSRVPATDNDFAADVYAPSCTTARPVFHSNVFGERGCAVLHPATPDAICHGAEDGGEMGAFHDRHHCLRRAAIHDKLKDYLPVGQKAVLIPDPRLLRTPPSTSGT
ncbi:MAG: phage tail protein [Gammaproteobacteria bacterium]|nr:phage tail protein [Gammaproteobacteria bacterium]